MKYRKTLIKSLSVVLLLLLASCSSSVENNATSSCDALAKKIIPRMSFGMVRQNEIVFNGEAKIVNKSKNIYEVTLDVSYDSGKSKFNCTYDASTNKSTLLNKSIFWFLALPKDRCYSEYNNFP